MSSTLLSTLELLQMNNYIAVASITLIIYDYLLTFPSEIDYVWRRPWTWVSTIFFLVRYVGLSFTILDNLNGTTFIPGPQRVSTMFYLVSAWEDVIFLSAADLVMILRVYAMWNRSKPIICVLLLCHVSQVIVSAVLVGIYYNPNTHLLVTVFQIINVYICSDSNIDTPSLSYLYEIIPRFILSAMLLVLAVIQTLKQSIGMYRATKQWKPNPYLQLLLKDGILYFLAMACTNVTTLIENTPSIAKNGTLLLIPTALGQIAVCIMMPRFIIDVRELYDRDLRGRRQGVDTGFGVSSEPISTQRTVFAIEFADVAPGQGGTVEGDAADLEPEETRPKERANVGQV